MNRILCNDVLIVIFNYLEYRDIEYPIKFVCKTWNFITTQKVFWIIRTLQIYQKRNENGKIGFLSELFLEVLQKKKIKFKVSFLRFSKMVKLLSDDKINLIILLKKENYKKFMESIENLVISIKQNVLTLGPSSFLVNKKKDPAKYTINNVSFNWKKKKRLIMKGEFFTFCLDRYDLHKVRKLRFEESEDLILYDEFTFFEYYDVCQIKNTRLIYLTQKTEYLKTVKKFFKNLKKEFYIFELK